MKEKEEKSLVTVNYEKKQAPLSIQYMRQNKSRLYIERQRQCRIVTPLRQSSSHKPNVIARELEKKIVKLLSIVETDGPVRRSKRSHRSIVGKFYSARQGALLQHESKLEKDFLSIVDFDCRVTQIKEQPLTLTYEDSLGSRRTYTPDYSVLFLKSNLFYRRAIIEIKYQEELTKNAEEFRDRFAAMNKWCSENNSEFHIVTDEDIKGVHLENVRALKPFKGDEDTDPEIEPLIYKTVATHQPISIGRVLDICEQEHKDRAYLQHYLWKQIAIGELFINLSEKLTYDTEVRLTPTDTEKGLFFMNG